jgi:hypothetical protein
MWRAVAGGVSVVVAAATGVVTALVTAHSSAGLWAALAVLVVVGGILQAAIIGLERRAGGRVVAIGHGAVAVAGTAGEIRTRVRGAVASSAPARSGDSDAVAAIGIGSVSVRGDAAGPISTDVSSSEELGVAVRRQPPVTGSGIGSITAGVSIGSASTTYIGTQVLGMSAEPVNGAMKDPASVYIVVDLEAFTGREWLASKIDEFLAAQPCGYLFVTAEAGLGKTAFAAWLVKTRGYFSHFSRYAGGRSIRAALLNLSAQLVTEFHLDDYAPGGMLPDWIQTPAGFESVLGQAAERARQDGRRVVLVVDGLDEAEPSRDGLAFGLPPMLPEGAYVVATYRTGLSPGRPESPAAVLPISRTDPRNIDDIRGYLNKAAGTEVMAARLAAAGTDPTLFTEQLTQLSGGVWVYLRYILEEVRLGLRAPDAIQGLPSGLLGYYAEQIRRWKQDPAWNDTFLPLLATIGVTGEPLPVPVLARLAGGLDVAAVRRWCELTARPLLSTTPPGPAGGPLRYEIYHASFRETLTAWPADDGAESAGAVHEFEPLADELRPAIHSAHNRIADCYLASFGGGDRGLPALAATPDLAGMDGGYALRWLPWHLLSAGRQDDLHRLLACGSEGRNVWFRAHDDAGDLTGYLRDIASARNSTSRLALQVRYAIVGASVASLSTMVPPVLLGELVRRRLWTPSRALDHVERMTDESRQAQALARIAPWLPSELLGEALPLALGFSETENRARALAAVIPPVPHHFLERNLDSLIDGVMECCRLRFFDPLAALASQLPGHMIEDLATRVGEAHTFAGAILTLFKSADRLRGARDALAMAVEHGEVYPGADTALASLLPYLPHEAFDDVFAAVRTIHQGDDKLARRLAKYAPAGRLGEIFDVVRWQPYVFVHDLAPRLSELTLAAAKDLCGSVGEGYSRSVMFAALAPRLSADEARDLLEPPSAYLPPFPKSIGLDARRYAAISGGLLLDRLPDEEARALVEDRLLPSLPSHRDGSGAADTLEIPAYAIAARHISAEVRRAVLREMALSMSISQSDAEGEAPFITRFAPLSEDDIDAVFGMLEKAQPLTWWPRSGDWLADFLAPGVPDETLEKIRDRVTSFPIEETCFTAIAALGRHQEGAKRGQTAERALALAAAMVNPRHKAKAVAELSPILTSGELATRAFDIVEDVGLYAGVRAKDRLAGALSVQQLQEIVDEACTFGASEAILHIPQTLARLAALGFTDVIDRVLPTAVPGSAEKMLRVAPLLSASQADRIWRSRQGSLNMDEAVALAVLTGRFPEEQRGARADEILSSYHEGYGDKYRVRVLVELARVTSTERLTQAMRDLFKAEQRVWDPILEQLAPFLPESLIEDAFRYAASVREQWHSFAEVAALAPRLPDPLAELAVEYVLAGDCDPGTITRAITALALRFRDDGAKRERLLAMALDRASARPDALAGLIPHLPARLRPRAVDDAVRGISRQLELKKDLDGADGDALRELLTALRGPELGDLYGALGQKVRDPGVRAQAQAAVLLRGRDQQETDLFRGNEPLHYGWPGAFDRAALMSLLAAAAWWLAEFDSTCVDDLVEAIFDAVTWWP